MRDLTLELNFAPSNLMLIRLAAAVVLAVAVVVVIVNWCQKKCQPLNHLLNYLDAALLGCFECFSAAVNSVEIGLNRRFCFLNKKDFFDFDFVPLKSTGCQLGVIAMAEHLAFVVAVEADLAVAVDWRLIE